MIQPLLKKWADNCPNKLRNDIVEVMNRNEACWIFEQDLVWIADIYQKHICPYKEKIDTTCGSCRADLFFKMKKISNYYNELNNGTTAEETI